MKFGKILCLFVFLSISSLSLCIKHHLRADASNLVSNNMLEFKDSTNNNAESTKVLVMEDVIKAKPTSIISKSGADTRFKERESMERSKLLITLVERNMESPVIIRAPATDRNFEDVRKRVASLSRQTISNTDGFNTIYKNHKVV